MPVVTDNPGISVIVLGWNGREYVDGCLTSLLDQDTDSAYEVIFVDNGSTDGTPDLAATFANVRVERLDHNYGYCIGNNKGYALTRGDIVVFLNQDVVLHRSWLRELVAIIESDPSVAAAHANIVQPWYPQFAGLDREKPHALAHTADLSQLGFIHYREVGVDRAGVDTLFLHGVSIAIRRSVLDELGYPFDPDMFAYAEDMDLALRVRNSGHRTVVATRAIVYHKHTLADRPSLATLRKTVRIIRNRLLALWKCSSWPEFAVLAAVTVIGSPFNAGEFGMKPWKRLLYGILLIPPTILAVPVTVVAMPAFAERRLETRCSARAGRMWLLRAMLLRRFRTAAAP